jgi:hypothetical protein
LQKGHHVSNEILSCSKKIVSELEKMILNMIQDLSFIKEEELLTVEDWQHVSQRKFFKERMKKEVNLFLPHPLNGMERELPPRKPHVANLVPLK